MVEAGEGALIVTGNTSAQRGRGGVRRLRADQGGAAHPGGVAGARPGTEGRPRRLSRDRCGHRRAVATRAPAGRSRTTSSSRPPRSRPRCSISRTSRATPGRSSPRCAPSTSRGERDGRRERMTRPTASQQLRAMLGRRPEGADRARRSASSWSRSSAGGWCSRAGPTAASTIRSARFTAAMRRRCSTAPAASRLHSSSAPNRGHTTLELKVSYLRGLSENSGTVRATGRTVSVGRRVAFAEADAARRRGPVVRHGHLDAAGVRRRTARARRAASLTIGRRS